MHVLGCAGTYCCPKIFVYVSLVGDLLPRTTPSTKGHAMSQRPVLPTVYASNLLRIKGSPRAALAHIEWCEWDTCGKYGNVAFRQLLRAARFLLSQRHISSHP